MNPQKQKCKRGRAAVLFSKNTFHYEENEKGKLTPLTVCTRQSN